MITSTCSTRVVGYSTGVGPARPRSEAPDRRPRRAPGRLDHGDSASLTGLEVSSDPRPRALAESTAPPDRLDLAKQSPAGQQIVVDYAPKAGRLTRLHQYMQHARIHMQTARMTIVLDRLPKACITA